MWTSGDLGTGEVARKLRLLMDDECRWMMEELSTEEVRSFEESCAGASSRIGNVVVGGRCKRKSWWKMGGFLYSGKLVRDAVKFLASVRPMLDQCQCVGARCHGLADTMSVAGNSMCEGILGGEGRQELLGRELGASGSQEIGLQEGW